MRAQAGRHSGARVRAPASDTQGARSSKSHASRTAARRDESVGAGHRATELKLTPSTATGARTHTATMGSRKSSSDGSGGSGGSGGRAAWLQNADFDFPTTRKLGTTAAAEVAHAAAPAPAPRWGAGTGLSSTLGWGHHRSMWSAASGGASRPGVPTAP
ncbi:MAG: hypothetical protein EOO41_05625 [Methanobacteriota archaeon]|nr:MAG: hypothetical protein EOO41_05625 [Euryarchaeota archaeon]